MAADYSKHFYYNHGGKYSLSFNSVGFYLFQFQLPFSLIKKQIRCWLGETLKRAFRAAFILKTAALCILKKKNPRQHSSKNSEIQYCPFKSISDFWVPHTFMPTILNSLCCRATSLWLSGALKASVYFLNYLLSIGSRTLIFRGAHHNQISNPIKEIKELLCSKVKV